MKLKDYDKAENSNIDFKEKVETSKPKSWLKSVSAFANTNGGVILFGVRDNDRFAVGLNDIVGDSEKVSQLINSKITPLPRYELNTFIEDKKDFIELKIGDGPRTPYYYDSDGRKEAFIRAGNESIPAPKHILDNLILKGQNVTYDELPSKYKLEDVSFTLLNATLKKETLKEIDKNKDHISLELITSDNQVTNAGLLLSDQGLL
jgi:ATP-dependent DNA helicase RecG